MERVFRGNFSDLKNQGQDFVRVSLEALKGKVTEASDAFEAETYYAVSLYCYQRQMDLRAKRRLLKGYSSVDLDNYGLRTDHKPIIFKADEEDSECTGLHHEDGWPPRTLRETALAVTVLTMGSNKPNKSNDNSYDKAQFTGESRLD